MTSTYTLIAAVAVLAAGAVPAARADCTIQPDAAGHLVIPNGTVTIGTGRQDFATCSPAVVTVSLPDSLTTIVRNVFSGCSSLRSIVIPDSVTLIEQSAFLSCGALASVTFGSSLATISHSAFFLCTSLQSVVIPGSVGIVGSRSFEGCTRLTSVSLNATTVDSYAFSGCTALTQIDLGTRLRIIGIGAFESCTALPAITVPRTLSRTQLGESAFHNCASLRTISIAADVEVPVGVFPAFSGCPCGESNYRTVNNTAVSLCDCVPTTGTCAPTVAPTSAPSQPPSPAAEASSDSDGLSTGGKVGVGVAVAFVLLLAAVALLYSTKTQGGASKNEIATGVDEGWSPTPRRVSITEL